MKSSIDDPSPRATNWRSRIRDDPSFNQHTEYLLDQLRQFYEDTHPCKEDATKNGKDHAAYEALFMAGKLVDHLAGWATDHLLGRTLKGQNCNESIHKLTPNDRGLPNLRQEADVHEHEQLGGQLYDYTKKADDFAFAKLALTNLLRTNPGGLPFWLSSMIDEALEALSYGEVLPLLKADKNKLRRARYRELNAQLRALQHVEYRVARNEKKHQAETQVGVAYGVDRETIRTWERRVKKELGTLIVVSRKAEVRDYASRTGEDCSVDIFYGMAALQQDANDYKNIIGQKG